MVFSHLIEIDSVQKQVLSDSVAKGVNTGPAHFSDCYWPQVFGEPIKKTETFRDTFAARRSEKPVTSAFTDV